MNATQEKTSHDFNHGKAIGLRASGIRLKSLEGYSALSIKILEDFLKPEEEENLNFSKNDAMYDLIKQEHAAFGLKCFDLAIEFIEDYAGGYWLHNADGIYCRWAKPNERFRVVNPHKRADETCNALEAGLAINLIALEGSMRSENPDFAKAMIYFRSRLMQLIEEQAKDGNTVINTEKVLSLIK